MTSTTKTTQKLRSGELADSLTGHDEVAIEKTFGRTLEGLADVGGGMFLRALLFGHYLHEGQKPGDAHKAVMDLPLSELRGLFAGGGDDDKDPELPGSEAGKEGP